MKTEKEIKELLETYKKIQKLANVFTPEHTLAIGAIMALTWVLKIDEVNGENRCKTM